MAGHCVKSVQMWSFFWSVFSRIRTEYGEILRISPYSVRMQENTDQKKLRIWTLFTQWRISEGFHMEYKNILVKALFENGLASRQKNFFRETL